MSHPVFIQTQIRAGVWEGVLKARPGALAPQITVWQGDQPLPPARLEALAGRAGHWLVRMPIPVESLSEGLRIYQLRLEDGHILGQLSVTVGQKQTQTEDLGAEIALLRAELELLKRAFRRHVAGAGSDPEAPHR